MRRIRLVLAVVAVVVAMLAAVSGPAMADVNFDGFDFDDNGDVNLGGDGVVFLDGDFFDFVNFDDNFFDGDVFNSDGGVFQSIGNEADSGDVSIGSSIS